MSKFNNQQWKQFRGGNSEQLNEALRQDFKGFQFDIYFGFIKQGPWDYAMYRWMAATSDTIDNINEYGEEKLRTEIEQFLLQKTALPYKYNRQIPGAGDAFVVAASALEDTMLELLR
jgi:hypothetical protein